jgi:hypothetical protein
MRQLTELVWVTWARWQVLEDLQVQVPEALMEEPECLMELVWVTWQMASGLMESVQMPEFELVRVTRQVQVPEGLMELVWVI